MLQAESVVGVRGISRRHSRLGRWLDVRRCMVPQSPEAMAVTTIAVDDDDGALAVRIC